ncbi:CAP domain-containing protein [Mucilaginibacter sp. SP1R1]|uniref:CAP domain-containing protein n=1 Tax=Mucilaginibacter sp. SP1R1 TaxID=2723091 RepID=UPI00181698C1|nr:CAP domain-containing protein [Mucilaginibacter sp. SP1R1]MBB6148235.1 uncharacterized protein YkwD [Mucilaginibacter sp. SP1R1]
MRKLIAKTTFTLGVLLIFGNVYGQSASQFKSDFLYRINLIREKGCNCGVKFMPPAPPLTWNNKLQDAAMGHAKDMARKNYFDHTSKDGRSMEDRIVFAGYTFKGFKSFAIGENIASGQTSIAEVMDGWFKSEGHCKNLMNPDFKEVGVAMYKNYWVQDFGGRQSFSAEQQRLIKSGRYRMVQEKGSGHD